MSFILDALKKSDRDKRLALDEVAFKPWRWDGWVSGQRYGGVLREKIRTSVSPYTKMLMIGALALTLSSAVAWASMAYFNESDSATVQIDGGINNSTTAGSDVSPAAPANLTALSAFLSDGMDLTKESVGVVREEQRKMTGVEYQAALIEEDATSATPAINFPVEDEYGLNSELYAADGIYLDGVSYHSASIKRRAILRRFGEAEGEVVKVGDMFAGLEVAAIHDTNISLKKGTTRFVIHLN